MEGVFHFGGHLRWNLGWPTPNYAGAFLATLLTLTFLFTHSKLRWYFWSVEAGGLLLLAKTYSRGAVVAWSMAWVFGFTASRGWRVPAERALWLARVAFLIIALAAVGFGWSRNAENVEELNRSSGAGEYPVSINGEGTNNPRHNDRPAVTRDGSALNRLALWQGGLKLIATAPIYGWGKGESGRAYMNPCTAPYHCQVET